MTSYQTSLRDKRVLVLEDDYYLATDLQAALEKAGAMVVGPFCDVVDAEQALIDATPDGAFIDVNLGEGPSFDMPRALAQRQVPFAFVTGYDQVTIPQEFSGVPRFEKPVAAERVVRAMAQLLDCS